jgi:hypothetical protein
MRSSKIKTGDRIRIRDHRAHTECDWLYGVYIRTHANRGHVVIRLDDDSLRAWPRHRVYKVKKK